MAAHITATRLTAAHEGIAEMIVTITYDNGGASEVSLDRFAVQALMNNSGADSPQALIGVRWENVRDALASAYNRFQQSE